MISTGSRWTGSRYILFLIYIIIIRVIVHAFTPIITTSTGIRISSRAETNIHRSTIDRSLQPVQPPQQDHHRFHASSFFYFRDNSHERRSSLLYMSDANTNPSSSENDAATSKPPMTSTHRDAARTSSVFLLEPDDPLALLSASPYTFPSQQQQRMQTLRPPDTTNEVPYAVEPRLSLSTASMLLGTSATSPATSSSSSALPSHNVETAPSPEPVQSTNFSNSVEKEIETSALAVTDPAATLSDTVTAAKAPYVEDASVVDDTTTTATTSPSLPFTLTKTTDSAESKLPSSVVEEDISMMDELLDVVKEDDDKTVTATVSSSVFVLEPNDPIASLSASPYTFPSQQQQQQQRMQSLRPKILAPPLQPDRTNEVPYAVDPPLSPSTASMLLGTSTTSPVTPSSSISPSTALSSPVVEVSRRTTETSTLTEIETRAISGHAAILMEVDQSTETVSPAVAKAQNVEAATVFGDTIGVTANPSEPFLPMQSKDNVESKLPSSVVEENIKMIDEFREVVDEDEVVDDETVDAIAEPSLATSAAVMINEESDAIERQEQRQQPLQPDTTNEVPYAAESPNNFNTTSMWLETSTTSPDTSLAISSELQLAAVELVPSPEPAQSTTFSNSVENVIETTTLVTDPTATQTDTATEVDQSTETVSLAVAKALNDEVATVGGDTTAAITSPSAPFTPTITKDTTDSMSLSSSSSSSSSSALPLPPKPAQLTTFSNSVKEEIGTSAVVTDPAATSADIATEIDQPTETVTLAKEKAQNDDDATVGGDTTAAITSPSAPFTPTKTKDSTGSTLLSSGVEENITMVDEFLEGVEEDDDEAVVAVSEPPLATNTVVVMKEGSETIRKGMNEDQKVINDLFIINDVFGIDPLSAMRMESPTVQENTLQNVEVTSSNEPIIEVDNQNIQSNLDTNNDIRNVITAKDNNDVDASAAQIDISRDDDLEQIEPMNSPVLSTMAPENDNIALTNVAETITITDAADFDKDLTAMNDLVEGVLNNCSSDVVQSNSISVVVADSAIEGKIEEALYNESIVEEEETYIQNTGSNIHIDVDDISLSSLSEPTAAMGDNLGTAFEPLLPTSDIDIVDAGNFNATDTTTEQTTQDSMSVTAIDIEDAITEVGASFVALEYESQWNASHEMDIAQQENINLETVGVGDKKTFDESCKRNALDDPLSGEVKVEATGTDEMIAYDEDLKNVVVMNEDWDTKDISIGDAMIKNSNKVDKMQDAAVEESHVSQEFPIEDLLAIDSSSFQEVDNIVDDSDLVQKLPIDSDLDDTFPFFLRYKNDTHDSTQELIVKPPSIPPQLSAFPILQASMVPVTMTREERIALAEQSFLSLEVKPGVKAETIKGAAIATLVFALLAGDELSIAMLGMVPAVSYFAVTRGRTGETIRIIGDLSWLWTAKFAEMLNSLDTSQVIAFWNAMQSITAKLWKNVGVLIAKQSALAEDEYYQKRSVALYSDDSKQQASNVSSDYYFMSTLDQSSDNENRFVKEDSAIYQQDLTLGKELEEIQLLLQDAEREYLAAKQKVEESYQRQLLIAKLDLDRRSAQMKQSLHDLEEERLKDEEEVKRKKMNEANQKALLESRIVMERKLVAIAKDNKEKRVVEDSRLKDEEKTKRETIIETKQRALLESRIVMERKLVAFAKDNEEKRVVEDSRLKDAEKTKRKTIIETKQRALLECRLAFERIEVARANEKQKQLTERKSSEAKQRLLFEARLKLDRQNMVNVREARLLAANLDRIRAKEAEHRSILGYRLSLERHMAVKSKIAAQLEEHCMNSKMTERKQRALLEARLSMDRNQKNLCAELERIEDQRLQADAAERARVSEEERLARIDEQTRLEEGSRLAEKSRTEALAQIEDENRRAEDLTLLAEMATMAKIEGEKRVADVAERARLASLDNVAGRIAETSKIENLALSEEVGQPFKEASSPKVENMFIENEPASDSYNPFTYTSTSITGKNLDGDVSAEALPWTDSRFASTSVEIEVSKPNVDAAKALLESVRRGESYQSRKEWWE